MNQTVNGIIYCGMLELCLMAHLLQDKPNVFQHDGPPPCIHSEVTTFLNREQWFCRGRSIVSSPRSPDANPLTFSCGALWKIPSIFITVNNLKDQIGTAVEKKNWTVFIAKCLKRAEYRPCAGQEMEHICNFYNVWKSFELLFTTACV
jgi:hypothetical protein